MGTNLNSHNSDGDTKCGCTVPNVIGAPMTSTLWSGLTTAQKTAACYTVEGNLVLNVNMSLSSKEFIMMPNSSITIGNNVIQFGYSNFHGCDYMWKGIMLTNAGSTLTFYHCKVEDAYYAVDRQAPASALLSYYTEFKNNYIGIYLNNTGLVATTPAIVHGCNFNSKALLPHPVYTTAGNIGLVMFFII